MFRGYEERLEDCRHAQWGLHNCDRRYDHFAVACSKSTPAQTDLAVLSKKSSIDQIFPSSGYRDA